MIGKDTLFCDGHTWNGSVPMCPGECCEATLSYKRRTRFFLNQKNLFGMIIFSSTSLSSTAGGEGGRGVNLNSEARNHGSHNLHSPGPLLKDKQICQLMRFIVFQEGNPHPEVGITFNGQPVGSKEFRRGRNTFTFTGFFSLSNGYEWILLNYLLYN